MSRSFLMIVGALLLLAPLTAAQQPSDPTVNDSDFNTTAPPADTTYMGENTASSSSTTDPTVSNSDFDTSPPAADTAYLDQASQQYGVGSTTPASPGPGNKVPAPSLAAIVIA